MTYSRDKEAELQMWWRITSETAALASIDPAHPDLAEWRDEAEVLMMHTQSPRLRERISAWLAGAVDMRAPVVA